jgi:hypothetical protein
MELAPSYYRVNVIWVAKASQGQNPPPFLIRLLKNYCKDSAADLIHQIKSLSI